MNDDAKGPSGALDLLSLSPSHTVKPFGYIVEQAPGAIHTARPTTTYLPHTPFNSPYRNPRLAAHTTTAVAAGGSGTTALGVGYTSDASIRCICGSKFDDGFSIACDVCERWCHAACFDIVEGGVPEEWKCWECAPRPVDFARAAGLQKERMRIIVEAQQRAAVLSALQLPAAVGADSEKDGGAGSGKDREKEKVGKAGRRASPATEKKKKTGAEGSRRRRRPSVHHPAVQQPTTGAIHSHDEEMLEIEDSWPHTYVHIEQDIVDGEATRLRMQQQAQRWRGLSALTTATGALDPVRLAQESHQTAGLAVRAVDPNAAVHPALAISANHDTRPPVYAAHTTQPVPSKGYISPYTSVLTPSSAYVGDSLNAYAHTGLPKPFVHLLGAPVDLALDARMAGCDARFVRSGCRPNAVLRPVLCGGPDTEGSDTLKFGVFALRDLKENEEVVLGWEWDDGNVVHTLPTLIESPWLFRGFAKLLGDLECAGRMGVDGCSATTPASSISPGEVDRLRAQIANILHALANTFTTCACGARSKDCAFTVMAKFVNGELPRGGDHNSYDGHSAGSEYRPDDVDRGEGSSRNHQPTVGPLGKKRGFMTREKVRGSGGMGGLEICGSSDEERDGRMRGRRGDGERERPGSVGASALPHSPNRTTDGGARACNVRKTKDRKGKGRALDCDVDDEVGGSDASLGRRTRSGRRGADGQQRYEREPLDARGPSVPVTHSSVSHIRELRPPDPNPDLMDVDDQGRHSDSTGHSPDSRLCLDGDSYLPQPLLEKDMPPKMRKKWIQKALGELRKRVGSGGTEITKVGLDLSIAPTLLPSPNILSTTHPQLSPTFHGRDSTSTPTPKEPHRSIPAPPSFSKMSLVAGNINGILSFDSDLEDLRSSATNGNNPPTNHLNTLPESRSPSRMGIHSPSPREPSPIQLQEIVPDTPLSPTPSPSPSMSPSPPPGLTKSPSNPKVQSSPLGSIIRGSSSGRDPVPSLPAQVQAFPSSSQVHGAPANLPVPVSPIQAPNPPFRSNETAWPIPTPLWPRAPSRPSDTNDSIQPLSPQSSRQEVVSGGVGLDLRPAVDTWVGLSGLDTPKSSKPLKLEDQQCGGQSQSPSECTLRSTLFPEDELETTPSTGERFKTSVHGEEATDIIPPASGCLNNDAVGSFGRPVPAQGCLTGDPTPRSPVANVSNSPNTAHSMVLDPPPGRPLIDSRSPPKGPGAGHSPCSPMVEARKVGVNETRAKFAGVGGSDLLVEPEANGRLAQMDIEGLVSSITPDLISAHDAPLSPTWSAGSGFGSANGVGPLSNGGTAMETDAGRSNDAKVELEARNRRTASPAVQGVIQAKESEAIGIPSALSLPTSDLDSNSKYSPATGAVPLTLDISAATEPPPPPTPVEKPKVKMTLKDFAMRKKRQRQEVEANTPVAEKGGMDGNPTKTGEHAALDQDGTGKSGASVNGARGVGDDHVAKKQKLDSGIGVDQMKAEGVAASRDNMEVDLSKENSHVVTTDMAMEQSGGQNGIDCGVQSSMANPTFHPSPPASPSFSRVGGETALSPRCSSPATVAPSVSVEHISRAPMALGPLLPSSPPQRSSEDDAVSLGDSEDDKVPSHSAGAPRHDHRPSLTPAASLTGSRWPFAVIPAKPRNCVQSPTPSITILAPVPPRPLPLKKDPSSMVQTLDDSSVAMLESASSRPALPLASGAATVATRLRASHLGSTVPPVMAIAPSGPAALRRENYGSGPARWDRPWTPSSTVDNPIPQISQSTPAHPRTTPSQGLTTSLPPTNAVLSKTTTAPPSGPLKRIPTGPRGHGSWPPINGVGGSGGRLGSNYHYSNPHMHSRGGYNGFAGREREDGATGTAGGASPLGSGGSPFGRPPPLAPRALREAERHRKP